MQRNIWLTKDQLTAYDYAAAYHGIKRHAWMLRALDVAAGVENNGYLTHVEAPVTNDSIGAFSVTLQLSKDRLIAYTLASGQLPLATWAGLCLDTAAGMSELYDQLRRIVARMQRTTKTVSIEAPETKP